VPGPLLDQHAALARQPPPILRLGAGRLHHRADLPLAAGPGHQGAHQRLAVDGIGLGAAGAPIDGNRRRIDDMAFDAVLAQQAVDPEAVEPRLLDHVDAQARADAPFRPRLQASQKLQQRAAIAARDDMLRQLLAARALTVTSQRVLLSSSEANSVLASSVLASGRAVAWCAAVA
jgi:hypothetical protein